MVKKVAIKITETENEVARFAEQYHDEAVRERASSLRAAKFSDDAIKTRLNNYRYRFFKGTEHFAYAGKEYLREVKLMLDAYTVIARERGLI
nr:MAG TPA: hypothetical protein [Caudoviricetes sp.]